MKGCIGKWIEKLMDTRVLISICAWMGGNVDAYMNERMGG